MLALAFVPCSDSEVGPNMFEKILGIEYEYDSDHDQHSKDCGDDHCTPFCICSCCSTVMDAPVKLPFKIIAPPPIPSEIPSFLLNLISSSFYAAIWQPPQLG